MPRRPRSTYGAVPVTATSHAGDQRVNIPTAELADFAVKEEQAPYNLRYPRDPSLDPQLVWKGKDEQDSQDLEVPTVPVYIQEHISPQAIVEDLRKGQNGGAPRQASLFYDFDGMEFGERIEFYRHSQNWTNRMILGDSLLVMTSLAEKEGLKGKVRTHIMRAGDITHSPPGECHSIVALAKTVFLVLAKGPRSWSDGLAGRGCRHF